jgi:hypothetical protein
VRANLLDSQRADPIDRRAKPDRLGDLRGPGFELPGQVGPRRFVGGNGPNHVTAPDERRHLLEQLAPAVQHTDSGGAIGLVPGPGVEVRVDRAELDRHLGDRLSPVDDQHCSGRVRHARDLRDGIDRPEHVRDVDDADQLWAAGEQ